MNPADSIALSQQHLSAARQPALEATGNNAKAREAAESFEAFFLGQFFEHMFANTRKECIGFISKCVNLQMEHTHGQIGRAHV